MRSWGRQSARYLLRGDEWGAGTLEGLVGLFLIVPIMLMLGAGIHNAVLYLGRMQEAYQSEYIYLKTSNLLRGLVQDLDSHTLEIPLRIHSGGWIQFSDGTPNPVVYSRAHSPDPGSDAVTGLALEVQALHDVRQAADQGWFAWYSACPRFEGRVEAGEDLSFVGVYAEGLVELRGHGTEAAGGGECREFRLRAEKSMSIAPARAPFLAEIKVLIPIVRQYTLYVDLNHQLRWLTHRGGENVENQPLLEGVRSIILQATGVFSGKIISLKSEVEPLGSAPRSFSVNNKLGRLDHINLLLNRL